MQLIGKAASIRASESAIVFFGVASEVAAAFLLAPLSLLIVLRSSGNMLRYSSLRLRLALVLTFDNQLWSSVRIDLTEANVFVN